MATSLTADDVRQSLNAHVAGKAAEIRARYGPDLGWPALQRLLRDRTQVRYPCDLVFDGGPLQPGECAHPVAKGRCPEDGFILFVHPVFLAQLQQVPLLVLYQLVVVNYGEFASSDDAETFGAGALGLSRDDYYRRLCALAEQVGGGIADSVSSS
jgi:hypothetical protein